MLSASSYLLGVAELAIVSGALIVGAAAARRRLLPAWSGAPAWLATAVLALALLIWLAELLGAVGLFEELPLIVGAALIAAALRLGLGPTGPGTAPPAPDPGTPMRLAGIAIAAVAVAHFTIGVRLRLSSGMTGFDSTWYHGPFAAGFAQGAGTLDVQFIAPQFLAWFYPQSSELVHAVGIVAFGRDLLSPLLNLGWMLGCLAAAWCIGRPYGAAPVSLAALAVVLDTGALADQAGEARNDLVALFFVLAALAVVLNARAAGGERLPGGALLIAGLAAGLAAGTKLNFLAPAAVIVAGLAAFAPAGGRRRALAVSGAAAVAGGGFWYLRNLVNAGSPLPWMKEIGPLGLPSPDQPLGGREGHSVISYATDAGVWSDWLLPGLHDGLGILWPALLLAALAGLVLCIGRRSDGALRLGGLVGLALLVAWLLAPTSASGPDGMPRGFVSALRYLTPALAVGMALLPLAPPLRAPPRRWGVLVGAAILLPFADASGEPWHSQYLLAAIAAGVIAAALAIGLGSARRRALPPRLAVTAGTVVVALAIAAGERGQRTYLRNRYADPQFTVAGLDAAFGWAWSISAARIATTGTRQYPLFGTELSNRVRFVGVERPNAGFVRARGCRAWRRALDAGGYDYVVATRDRFQPGKPAYPPEAGWTAGDPAASIVLRRPPTVVFRIDGRLDPRRCPGGSSPGGASD